MKLVRRKALLAALGLLAATQTACKDPIGSVQIAVVGKEGKVSLDGNPTAKDGVADGAFGFTLEEGYAAVVDVNVVEGDPLVKDQDSIDYPEVTSVGVTVKAVSDTKDKRWLVWLADGAKVADGELVVTASGREGEVRIPVRVRAQPGAGRPVTPAPWPYGAADAGADASR